VRISLVRQLLLLLGLAFLPAIGQAVYYRNSISWAQPPVDSAPVSLAQTESWGGSVLWLDARPDEQFVRRHIPGALQLNEDRWDELLRAMLVQWSPTRKVVVYCSRESCHASHEVAERLRKEAGLTNVYVLQGGWEEWETAHR
jgi:rhodanese-related sulfurtransferase